MDLNASVVPPVTIGTNNLYTLSPAVLAPETPPAAYNAGTTYSANQTVAVVDGFDHLVYKSLVGGNLGNTPASSPAFWVFVGICYPAYNGATTYAAGEIVTSTTTHRIYESLVAGESGNPLTDDTKWLDIGPTNRWAMFDQVNETATTRGDGLMRVIVLAGNRVNTIGLLGLTAQRAQVRVSATLEHVPGGAATIVYDETHSLADNSQITDWYQYFTADVLFKRHLVIEDIPYGGLEFSVTLWNVSLTGEVGLANLLFGRAKPLGVIQKDAKAGTIDYSRIVTDEQFGRTSITRRSYAKRANFTTVLEGDEATVRGRMDFVQRTFEDLRATPCLWIGDARFGPFVLFGIWEDYDLTAGELTTLSTSLKGYI